MTVYVFKDVKMVTIAKPAQKLVHWDVQLVRMMTTALLVSKENMEICVIRLAVRTVLEIFVSEIMVPAKMGVKVDILETSVLPVCPYFVLLLSSIICKMNIFTSKKDHNHETQHF